jgi:phospholipid/cholesterol/gamma-HCH transport system substrate-binding protein
MRSPRGLIALISGLVVVALIAVGVVIEVQKHNDRIHITAYFSESNGIYVGNHVDILGLPIGSVSSVSPEPGRVKVVLSLPKGTKVPANAYAVIVPPSVISDRYVQLQPAYAGSGPLMADGHVIPVGDNKEPAEFDQLVGSLTTLFNALGPKEANAKGAVGQLIKVLSANLDGNGQRIHDTIEGLSSATSALTSDSGGVAAVIRNLDELSKNLAARDKLIGSFNSDLAGASSQLSAERTDITSVVDNLSSGLLVLSSFIKTHRSALHDDLGNLVTTTNLLLKHQRTLIETLDNLPLAAQNLKRVNHHGAITVRQAGINDSQVLNSDLTKICALLGPVCKALALTSKSSDDSLAPLFGVTK